MTCIKNYLSSLDNKEQKYLLIAMASIFMPYVITGVILFIIFVRLFFVKALREKIFKEKDFKLVAAFFVLNLLPPIFFKNYLGLACFGGVFIILTLLIYFRSYITKNAFSKMCDIMAFMSMCAAVVAKVQRTEPDFRSPSVFFNPNYYGAVITLVVIVCFYRIVKKEGNLFFMMAAIIVNAYGLLQADCQSAFFCIAFGIWLVLLLTKKYIPLIVVTVLAIIFVAALPYLDFIMPRISNAAGNILRRSKIWLAGLNGFLESPILGRGMMGYLQIYKEYGGSYNFHCHNLIIDLLLSFGVVGSVPLVVFVLKNIIAAKARKYAPLLFSLVGAVMLHSMVDVTIGWIQTGGLCAMLVAMAYIKEE